jgi:hypothetical protein
LNQREGPASRQKAITSPGWKWVGKSAEEGTRGIVPSSVPACCRSGFAVGARAFLVLVLLLLLRLVLPLPLAILFLLALLRAAAALLLVTALLALLALLIALLVAAHVALLCHS